MMTQRLARICRRGLLPRHRQFSRNVFTKDQIKTAELQKTSHTPNQVVMEVPHSTESSVIDVPSPLWYHRLHPVKDFFTWFSQIQRRRLLGIALGTSLATYLYGGLLAFLFLGGHFNNASKRASIMVKVVIQQFFFTSIFNTYFFGMQAMLSGEAPSVITHRIVSTVPESVVSSAKFWPAVTAMNFTRVPTHLRFTFSGFFAVIWRTYLSYLNRREEKTGPSGTLADQARQKLYEDAPSASVADVLDGVDGGSSP
ncbi:uncharacterized protein Z519_09332 [Cladophialophora bantiana CBS 173.52]|uniref:Uncharacterized protein n=1 Tax=Cladophialophora bantiana (strain ATCC 10958 / CBS 173.52 / CDC B-1940 / NIH 8579) TaxID=1442370 RepID=A0A0D2H9G4_CLAB1|nr:uncharacterized protein Z519_09332 [Cladophialophora bantiana CBS 173.52]KIW89903.1 hypothetical protein Z519_09332 [Cladophialophora bantiana CBS 173.52]